MENRVTVEAGQTAPYDTSLFVDQGADAAVADDAEFERCWFFHGNENCILWRLYTTTMREHSAARPILIENTAPAAAISGAAGAHPDGRRIHRSAADGPAHLALVRERSQHAWLAGGQRAHRVHRGRSATGARQPHPGLAEPRRP